MIIDFGIHKMIAAGIIIDEQGIYLYAAFFFLEIKINKNGNR
jgi:hypothetical protein